MSITLDLFYSRRYEKIKELINNGAEIEPKMLMWALVDEQTEIAELMINRNELDLDVNHHNYWLFTEDSYPKFQKGVKLHKGHEKKT